MPDRSDPLEGHVILGFLFSLASAVLLTLVTFSAPFIPSIHFLHAAGTRHGGFGYCADDDNTGCTSPKLGYDTGREVVEWLTRMHIMFALAAICMILAFIALVLSVLRVGKFMWNPIYFRTTALLGTLLSLLATIFALINFVTARNRFNSRGVSAVYGPALWMGLGGAISALLAVAIGGPKFTARYLYRADNMVAHNI